MGIKHQLIMFLNIWAMCIWKLNSCNTIGLRGNRQLRRWRRWWASHSCWWASLSILLTIVLNLSRSTPTVTSKMPILAAFVACNIWFASSALSWTIWLPTALSFWVALWFSFLSWLSISGFWFSFAFSLLGTLCIGTFTFALVTLSVVVPSTSISINSVYFHRCRCWTFTFVDCGPNEHLFSKLLKCRSFLNGQVQVSSTLACWSWSGIVDPALCASSKVSSSFYNWGWSNWPMFKAGQLVKAPITASPRLLLEGLLTLSQSLKTISLLDTPHNV